MKLSQQDFDIIFDALSAYAVDVHDNSMIDEEERAETLKKIEEAENALETIGTY